jgi:hypothetical protein
VDVAIRGDRASCLTMQLGPRTWLLAVARGFGAVDGLPTERALLARLRAECERRLHSERFRRAVGRPQAAASAILSALARVNGDLFARTAGHDDYVTAASSLTMTLIVRAHAYVMHCGGTAAYLVHENEVAALSRDDTLDEALVPLLSRAVGTSATLDVTVSSVILDEGDLLVLLGHRVRGEVDRGALIEHVESNALAEHVLVARFERGDSLEAVGAADPRRRLRANGGKIVRIAAAIGLALALVFAR